MNTQSKKLSTLIAAAFGVCTMLPMSVSAQVDLGTVTFSGQVLPTCTLDPDVGNVERTYNNTPNANGQIISMNNNGTIEFDCNTDNVNVEFLAGWSAPDKDAQLTTVVTNEVAPSESSTVGPINDDAPGSIPGATTDANYDIQLNVDSTYTPTTREDLEAGSYVSVVLVTVTAY